MRHADFIRSVNRRISNYVEYGSSDPIAADELMLYLENDGDLYERRFKPILNNMMKKINKGVYDHEAAVKGWMYLVDDAAKKYTQEFSAAGDRYHDIFPKDVRWAVAQQLADDEYEKIQNGEYD